METRIIKYNDSTYLGRIVKDKDGNELLIGNYGLLDTLQPYECDGPNEGFANNDAKEIFETIFYFVDNNTLWGDEASLIAELKEANPDFFD